MAQRLNQWFWRVAIACFALGVGLIANAQTTLPGPRAMDTAMRKTNTNSWKQDDAIVVYETLNGKAQPKSDSSVHFFHRRPFLDLWHRDLGNPGSPTNSTLFEPAAWVGPALGYIAFDRYRFRPDSLRYFNTTRPYSEFSYQLGSKLEQVAGLLHTQNIRPNWNFMAQYRKISTPGFFKLNRNNHDNFCFTTNYKSLDQHYKLWVGLIYNKQQHDENGGIVNDSQLTDPSYTDRRTLDVVFQNNQYSLTRSTVSNVQRDFTAVLRHSYTWGSADTLYTADSTDYTWRRVPRFTVGHSLKIGTERYTYKDLAPDSLRYAPLFAGSFSGGGTPYYARGRDSVITQQKWFWVDNEVTISGSLGAIGRQVAITAGAGNRLDVFSTNPNVSRETTTDRLISNYLTGSILKMPNEAMKWQFEARALLFVTGAYAGDFEVNGRLSRNLRDGRLRVVVFAAQQAGSAPYNFRRYENPYVARTFSFEKQLTTNGGATISVAPARLSFGVRSQVLGNYIYCSSQQLPTQRSKAFTVNSLWISKTFRVGSFFLDNEVVYQRVDEGAPVNVPALMGRHQLCFDGITLRKKLVMATGFDVRYTNAFYVPGYSALLNRFYYQDEIKIANIPEVAFFLNFKVKRFRAFIMLDQLQQLASRNAIQFVAPSTANFYGDGVARVPVYAAQNAMLRFGFNWVLIN
jgi:hypothetical protein